MATYKVDFLPSRLAMGAGEDPRKVAGTIENSINQYASQGYELVQVAQLAVTTSPGCLAALFGQKDSTIDYNMLVFKSNR